MERIREISPTQVKERLDGNENFLLIDVRERDEWDYCRIEEAELKPLSEIMRWMNELDPDGEYVFVCHHGYRSRQMCIRAMANGIRNVANLTGGIAAWSREVDPGVPTY